MDLPKVPEFIGARLADAKKDLAALGLHVSDLGASSRMHEKDPKVREAQFDEGRRFIDLAQAMGVKYVRMFGDKIPEGESKDEVMKRVIEGFRKMAEYGKPGGVTVLIESHGDFTKSPDIEHILTAVNVPNFQLLWDAHHSYVAGGEKQPGRHLREDRQVGAAHAPEGLGRPAPPPSPKIAKYVLLGTGDVPVKEQVKVMAAAGYKGLYCFEWEKKWHPEIEEPEVAFPDYAKKMAEYLTAAGVKPS